MHKFKLNQPLHTQQRNPSFKLSDLSTHQDTSFVIPRGKINSSFVEKNRLKYPNFKILSPISKTLSPINRAQYEDARKIMQSQESTMSSKNRNQLLTNVTQDYHLFRNQYKVIATQPNEKVNDTSINSSFRYRKINKTLQSSLSFTLDSEQPTRNTTLSRREKVKSDLNTMLDNLGQKEKDIEIDYNSLDKRFSNQNQKIVKTKQKSKLSTEYVEHQGKRVPFTLHLINEMSKKLVENLVSLNEQRKKDRICEDIPGSNQTSIQKRERSQREEISSQKLREEINTKIKPEQERRLMATIFKKEKSKKYQEYLSRNSYDNPYCQILALTGKSRKRIMSKIRTTLPIESRFQLNKL